MQSPSFLPTELHTYTSFQNEKLLFQALIKNPSDLIEFFEYACADETWSERHLGLIRSMMRWGAKEFYLSRLPMHLVRRMVKAIQGHHALLEPFLHFRPALFFTMAFTIADQVSIANSLLYGGCSPYFRDRFKIAYDQLVDQITLSKVPLPLFKLVDTYILKGEIADLWRHEYEEILALMQLAKDWALPDLVKECTEILRRYIDKYNVIDTLLKAHKEYFFGWEQECYEVFNRQEWSLKCLPGRDGDLRIQILDVKQETIDLFCLLAPWITHLAFNDEVCQSSFYGMLINKCPKLVGADFSGCLHYSNQFDILPINLAEINLSACFWVKPEHLREASLQFPSLKALHLANNTQLTYSAWGVLRQFHKLISLTLSYCHQLVDSDLKLISQSCPFLNEIDIEECKFVTDQGVKEIISYCLNLNHLNINRCYALTDESLLELGTRAFNLTHLSAVRCSAFSDKGLWRLVELCNSLRYLNVKECDFSLQFLEKIRKQYPLIDLVD